MRHSSLITEEVRARALGGEGSKALESVLRRADWIGATKGPLPASKLYVDDFMGCARTKECSDELTYVRSRVFELMGLPEKILKHEGLSMIMVLLGFLFCTVLGVL